MRVLYLDLDTLRPDHLGCYGYHRNTSPNIDAVCAEGMRFDEVYCSDAPCLPSRGALMSGQFGIHTGLVGHAGTCADRRIDGSNRGFRDRIGLHSLPAFLKQSGLFTTYIGGFGERHSAWSFYAGFREIHDTGSYGMESAEEVTPTALEWIERNAAKDNWYLQVNYWDAHTPYRAPASFGNPFAQDPLPAWMTEEIIQKHRQFVGPHTAQDLAMWDNSTDPQFPRHPGELKSLADYRHLIDGYDCGIAYMDSHLGRLFDALKSQGVWDDLVIIISADHGENMGELGIYAEHATADRGTCHIPLIIRVPGVTKGGVDRGLHYNLDLPPTLADLMNKKPSPFWEGQSFAPAILTGTDCSRDYLVLSQCAHVCQRSVRWNQWLYLCTWHDGYHLFPQEMLYDLQTDPWEQTDLAAQFPEIVQQGAAMLKKWYDQMMATQPEGYSVDPMTIVLAEGGPFHAKGQLKRYCERLEKSDRAWAVEELRRRHPQEPL